MKLRHVRAMAICGVALVALTGARSSGGGGCSSSSSSSSSGGGSSSSSSSGGGSHSDGDKVDGDDSYGSTSGYTSGGSTTGDTTGGSTGSSTSGSGGRSKTDPASDVQVESCTWSDSHGITARVSATNSSGSQAYDYKFSVTFTDPNGTVLRKGNPSIPWVRPGTTDTLDTSTPYIPKAGEDTSAVGCKVSDVRRTER